MSARRVRAAAAVIASLVLTACDPSVVEYPAASGMEPEPAGTGLVVAVVDGDTIDVDGETHRVRLIGIDAPEIDREGGQSDCYADDARTFLDELLYGETVQLEVDPTQDAVDDYDRLLRHVLIDGDQAGLLAIQAGAALEYTYSTPHAYSDDYATAQGEAEEAGVGLWGSC